jgi:hypothetical protein
MPKAPERPPYRSGWCNLSWTPIEAYADSHRRCSGCVCDCHKEVPVTEQPDPPTDTPAPGTPEDAVAWLRSATDALNTSMKGYDAEHWHDAARLLDSLRKVTARLGVLDASLVQWLYLHGEHGLHQQVPGIAGTVNITRGRAKERWAAPEAVREYVDRKMAELEGEIPDPEVVVGWVLEVLPASQSTSLRKTPLRAAGIDLDDFYWSEPGSLQVGLPKPDLTAET